MYATVPTAWPGLVSIGSAVTVGAPGSTSPALESSNEADSSMLYYGLPGRRHPDIENLVVNTARQLATAVRTGQ